MKLALVLTTVLLTGCASGVNMLASIYDGADVCQQTQLLKTDPNKYRTYCSGSSGKTYVTRDYMTNRAIATTK